MSDEQSTSPMTLTTLLARVDRYLLLLVGTVVLAAILPVRGIGAKLLDAAVFGAVALLFFLYGARLAPRAVLDGLLHLRLQALVFASTYVLFPIVGLAAVRRGTMFIRCTVMAWPITILRGR